MTMKFVFLLVLTLAIFDCTFSGPIYSDPAQQLASLLDWQYHVDNLINSGFISDAAIIGEDGSVLAKSERFKITTEEAKNIVGIFESPELLPKTGLTVSGVKYRGELAKPKTIYGHRGFGGGGLVCVQTAETVIIGVYKDRMIPGKSKEEVEKLGEYFRNSGH